MKRGEIIEGIIERYDYPGRGVLMAQGREVYLKGALPGQKVRCRIKKNNASKCEAMLLDIVEKSPMEKESNCPHFPECGGCQLQTLSYPDQLAMKEKQIRRLLEPSILDPEEGWFEGIQASPSRDGYRNKMEFTFGDSYKGGPMVLGMHKKGSFYDIVNTSECRIIDPDLRQVRTAVLALALQSGFPYYHRLTHIGYFRHLLVRKTRATGQIMVDLVTTTQSIRSEADAGTKHTSEDTKHISPEASYISPEAKCISTEELDRMLVEKLLNLPLEGTITGILHTYNDSVADTIQNDSTKLLYGKEYIEENLLGMKFRITPFSFFQTNSGAAELLYDTVRNYVGDTKDKVIFDLYSGTGTIAQILAPVAKHVTGVEIVEEAVEAARINAEGNGLANCDFICGDVLKVVDSLPKKPDMIILDPPRDGIHPKAMPKLLRFGVDRIIYISCKATSLKRDLIPIQQAGYHISKMKLVDLFPGTAHIETIVLLQKLNS